MLTISPPNTKTMNKPLYTRQSYSRNNTVAESDMRKSLEYGVVYTVGAAGYTLVEIMWRGYSHWTMALTGGACLALIYLNESKHHTEPLWKRCLVGSLIITNLEFAVGFVVNMLLHWHVWDYSNQALNLFGQVCVLYSVLWFLLCVPAAKLCAALRHVFSRGYATEREMQKAK